MLVKNYIKVRDQKVKIILTLFVQHFSGSQWVWPSLCLYYQVVSAEVVGQAEIIFGKILLIWLLIR